MSNNKVTTMKLTQNGKLDKRFTSTKNIENQVNSIKLTKKGKPDKRFTEVKNGKIKVKVSDGKVKGSSKLGKNMALL